MKTFLFLYDTPDFDNISLTDSQRYSYERLYDLGIEQNIKFVRSSIFEYNFNDNEFKKYWEFDPKSSTWGIKTNIKPDLIIDKCKQTIETFTLKKAINSIIPMLNNPYFTEICDNKIYSYLALEEFSPLTKIIARGVKLEDFNSGKLVLKPIYGSGGTGVSVIDKKSLELDKYTDYLVQEYIETKKGIAGFNRRHDLRVVILNSEIVQCYIRSPRDSESMISNVALGGEEIGLDLDKIPSDVIEIAKKVDRKFSKTFGILFYSIDFLIDESHQPHIVEINSKPGLYPGNKIPTEIVKYDYLFNKLIYTLKNYVTK